MRCFSPSLSSRIFLRVIEYALIFAFRYTRKQGQRILPEMALVMPLTGRQLLQRRIDCTHQTNLKNENICWKALHFVLQEHVRAELAFSAHHRKALECELATQALEETSHEEVRLESSVFPN